MEKDLYFDPRYDLSPTITHDSQGKRYQQVAPEFGGELIPLDGDDECLVIPIPLPLADDDVSNWARVAITAAEEHGTRYCLGGYWVHPKVASDVNLVISRDGIWGAWIVTLGKAFGGRYIINSVLDSIKEESETVNKKALIVFFRTLNTILSGILGNPQE